MEYEIRNVNGVNDIAINDISNTKKKIIYFSTVKDDTHVHELSREFTLTHGQNDSVDEIKAQAESEVQTHFNDIHG